MRADVRRFVDGLKDGLRPARDEAEQHRRGILVENTKHLRQEIEQIFTDCDHWNRTHPDEEPVDADPNGELRRITNAIDAFLATEQPRPM